MRRLVLAGVLATVVLIGAGCAAAKSDSSATAAARPATKHQRATRPVPAWAEKCLPRGSQRLRSAPQFVGLTLAAAQRLSGGDLELAGAGGRCSHVNDLVYRRHPIAVVFNTRPRRPKARVIAAVRAAAGWQPGGLTLLKAPQGVGVIAREPSGRSMALKHLQYPTRAELTSDRIIRPSEGYQVSRQHPQQMHPDACVGFRAPALSASLGQRSVQRDTARDNRAARANGSVRWKPHWPD